MLRCVLGTWPAFWLMDVTSLVNRSMDAHEIDVLEQYGDGIGILRTTLHYWSVNGTDGWGQVTAAAHATYTHRTACTANTFHLTRCR